MMQSNVNVSNNDIKNLIKDAQSLLDSATALTGDKAEEVRSRAMRLLDTVVSKVQDTQTCTLVAGKEMAVSADDYVKENPWSMVATAAGAGFLMGVILMRK
jgi:ElaB/YqjD/DUF883 family membrane-anchored ribosome-binding protein